MNREEVTNQISIYEEYRKNAKARGEPDVAKFYEDHLRKLRNDRAKFTK